MDILIQNNTKMDVLIKNNTKMDILIKINTKMDALIKTVPNLKWIHCKIQGEEVRPQGAQQLTASEVPTENHPGGDRPAEECSPNFNLEPNFNLPGKPVAYNYGPLSMDYGLLWGIVAYYLGYLAFQVDPKSMKP